MEFFDGDIAGFDICYEKIRDLFGEAGTYEGSNDLFLTNSKRKGRGRNGVLTKTKIFLKSELRKQIHFYFHLCIFYSCFWCSPEAIRISVDIM